MSAQVLSTGQPTLATTVRRVGILHHPRIPETRTLAQTLAERVRAVEGSAWIGSAWEYNEIVRHMANLDLMVTLGGDGTLLRAARSAAPFHVPVLGVNFGRLGFLTELRPADAVEGLERVLAGEGWLDERGMLRVEIWRDGGRLLQTDGLNDCFVGRGPAPRTVRLTTRINGSVLATIAGDGVIVATSTGSTAYSVAAGGPILAPNTPAFVLTPVAAHLLAMRSLVLPTTTTVEIETVDDPPSVLSVDGQVNLDLAPGDRVLVSGSPYSATFIRLRPANHFFGTLLERLR